MPKKSDAPTPDSAPVAEATPAPILIPIASGDQRLPSGLSLGQGTWWAAVLPDGRAVPQGLPDATLAQFYPDLVPPPAPAAADLPPPPSVTEV